MYVKISWKIIFFLQETAIEGTESNLLAEVNALIDGTNDKNVKKFFVE
jgi:hypothetical protein